MRCLSRGGATLDVTMKTVSGMSIVSGFVHQVGVIVSATCNTDRQLVSNGQVLSGPIECLAAEGRAGKGQDWSVDAETHTMRGTSRGMQLWKSR